jgi:hypothetical protein
MQVQEIHAELTRLPGALPTWHGVTDAAGWKAGCRHPGAGRRPSCWRCGRRGAAPRGPLRSTPPTPGRWPGVARTAACHGRSGLSRPGRTVSGGRPHAAGRRRPVGRARRGRGRHPALVEPRAWPAGFFPLQHPAGSEPDNGAVRDYPFVARRRRRRARDCRRPSACRHHRTRHFRFSVVGEKVLRLEERLGYTHKGNEQRFTDLPPLEGYRLAGRVSGDSTVAYAGPTAWRWNRLPRARSRNGRSGCVRCCWSGSGWPTTWETWCALWATTPASAWPWRSSPA